MEKVGNGKGRRRGWEREEQGKGGIGEVKG